MLDEASGGAAVEDREAVIGLDFGATNIKAMAFDAAGGVIAAGTEPSRLERGVEPTLERLAAVASAIRQEAAAQGYQVTGVGVGVCSPVCYERGEIIESSVLPGWKDVPVAGPLSTALGLPIALENDANLAVLGEWWCGSAKGAPIVAGMTLGTGIGGGFVIGGEVYRGAFGYGAEFGHIGVGGHDSPCSCGGQGCLGRVASITATLERFRKLSNGSAAVLGMLELAELARAGDPAAREAIGTSVQYISDAVLILVNCLNPSVFVLAGGMAALGDLLLEPIRNRVRTSTYRRVASETRVVLTELGLHSGCYGAGYLACRARDSRQMGTDVGTRVGG